MASIKELEELIASKQAAYHAAADTMTRVEERERSLEIKGLRSQLSDALSAGASACPDCGAKPLGMLKRRASDYDIYEVGCPLCPTRARGGSSDAAVEKWNKRDLVKDEAYTIWMENKSKN